MKGYLNTFSIFNHITLDNFVESDLGCSSRYYFDNVTLTSQQHNNQFDCSKANGFNIPHDAIMKFKSI